jgi:23S rRNA (uracil1939-C5)-methyltransferase
MQGDILELEINDLSNNGDGVGKHQGMVIFVPDTVTGDKVKVRVVRLKSNHGYGKLLEIIEPSDHRIRPRCIVADKCGGCQWQHIDYQYQLKAKEKQVTETLKRIGGFEQVTIEPIMATRLDLGYRNKATYPIGFSKDAGKVKTGYYRKGTHQIINLNQCPVQDERLNPFLEEIKWDIQSQNWTIYDEKLHKGALRHLSLRIGRRTGEILLTLITKNLDLQNLEQQANHWLRKYPDLVGVCVNHNPHRGNVIFGEKTTCIAGRGYLREIFADLELQLLPETFFQVNTETAESLLNIILAELNLRGNEILVDAYCGIGTFTLPLAKQVQKAIGIEIEASSITQAKLNAEINYIDNVSFEIGEVETILPQLNINPNIVILDPPRKGCKVEVINSLLALKPERIVYISCNPATLARDLKLLCEHGDYKLVQVKTADFFPQTSHVESVVFLQCLS